MSSKQSPSYPDFRDALNSLPLFDHHCHGVVPKDLARTDFEAMISESSRPAPEGLTCFDSQLGFQVLSRCAPVIGAEAWCSPDEYLEQRRQLGAAEANSRLLQAAQLTDLGVDTGFSPDVITPAEELGRISRATPHEVVRLEYLAEQIAQEFLQPSAPQEAADSTARKFLDVLEERLSEELRGAIGVKSIAAYRIGLDFQPERPATGEVLESAQRLLSGTAPLRLADPVLIRHLLWLAIDAGQVIQLHIGYGDDDVDLHRCNPLLLTELFRLSRDTGARFTLLHCYPFHREAGYLAHVFEHVYFDVGLAINYTGSRSDEVIAESLELAPFGKILFSTDAFGLAELYYLGAELFRDGLAQALAEFHDFHGWPKDQCLRVARMISYDNAAHLYGTD